MPPTRINITQEMIDIVFGDPILRKKFTDPEKAKKICEIRLTGATYLEIGKKVKMSDTYCRRNIQKLIWIYRLFSDLY